MHTSPLFPLISLLALSSHVAALPAQSLDFSDYLPSSLLPRADKSLTSYLGTFFLGDVPSVYFYASNGNSGISFRALNKGQPVLTPTEGTGGVRDPALIAGGGPDAQKKWFIVGTDLDIAKTTWDASQRNGSRSIFVWESNDLVSWSKERLVEVEGKTAGMVWAPDALWDEDKGQYLVYWASNFYAANDSKHSGVASAIKMRYAYTKDFNTFSAPQDYVDRSPINVIDLNILPLGGKSYARFLKDETAKTVYTEISTTGLFGTWTRPQGANAVIASGVEGPAAYWDNQVAGKAHLLLDYYGGDGYKPYETEKVESGLWTPSNTSGFPPNLRHGSVLPVNASVAAAVAAKWP